VRFFEGVRRCSGRLPVATGPSVPGACGQRTIIGCREGFVAEWMCRINPG